MDMFMGSYKHRIDTKGRLVMPSKFRSQLGDTVVCTLGLDGCLAVYPMEEWESYLKKLQALPFSKTQARQFMRALLGAAEDISLDAQGRILISSRLRAYAHLGENVVVCGVNDHLEIWNEETWAANDAALLENFTAIAEGVEELGI